ncbi:hypothetical protein DDB_G0295813 [Dictyostelium discoideum AX4]|uniref:Uncharacterized protein n=1 Tax=Dictyostelium discoideum TaxID=44689 RepID=C7G065_DICDI|nr:hypothetical protein DDB_G0295813 [Dictyostelium discoideum AX4]EEU04055.1 hypothetical protein DDB_G0295813 [Dictyostelium discoideum AX4]|eukprot:XP_002649107.1 hypothetical protein DDB_G0295813 [Dictyostelium discoideum AX4]
MEERATNKCPHSNLSIEEAEENKSKYMWLLTDPDEFPEFEPCVCTTDCKVKMVKIIDIILYNHYKFSRGYFEDCKMVFGHGVKGLSLYEYTNFIKKNRFKERTELLTNLQYIDGKVVRLCDVPKENEEKNK